MGPQVRYNFTQDFLKNVKIPSPGKRAVYYDNQQRNLSLIVTSTGTKSFYVQRTHHGITTRFLLGRANEMDLRDARTKASEYAREIAAGKSKQEILNTPKRNLTLNEYADYYIEHHAKPHKASWRYEASNYRVHVKNNPFAERLLSHVQAADIQQLHTALGSNRGHVIANRVLSMLAIMFNKAIDDGYYPHANPAAKIKRFREYARSRFLSGDELPAFWSALEQTQDNNIRDYIILSLLTGARKGNVLGMKWENIDFSQQEWHIPKTKNGDAQTIPLVGAAMEILNRRYLEKKMEYVFPPQRSDSTSPHMVQVKRAWDKIMVTAGFKNEHGQWLREKLTLHDLRRTSGSWQTKTGASAFVVGKSLGHKSPKSTQIYARMDLDPVRTSLTKAADAILKFNNFREK